jgi:acyl dehydratase
MLDPPNVRAPERPSMIDETLIGHAFPPHSADVEASRLRLFAKAIGETRPEYCDEAAARAAGHPSLPAPPTYAFCLYLDVPDPFAWYRELGIDLGRVLHGAQSFRYFAPVHAGDRLTFASRIGNVFRKKNGALTFIIRDTLVTNQAGLRIAEIRSTIVVRGG